MKRANTVRALLWAAAPSLLLIAGLRPAACEPLGRPTLVRTATGSVVASAVVTEAPWSADATGRSDASPAIQRALDAVTEAGGGIVYAPAGRYRLDRGLQLGYATALQGAGGSPERDPLSRRTLLMACGASGDEPLLDVTGGEGAVIGLSVWYPNQRPEDPWPYPYTIVASMATIRNVCLLNAYHGLRLKSANGCFVDDLCGTVLAKGLSAPHSTEFSWVRGVRFANRFWRQAYAELHGSAMSASQSASLDRFTRRNLVGAELGRLDAMAIDGLSAGDAAVPLRIRKDDQQNQHPVFGYGGVARGLPTRRDEFGWDGWYYGMRYADLDAVPEAGACPPLAALPEPPVGPAGLVVATDGPYGARGDGAADDWPALDAAVRACASRGGGIVYLPCGRYRLTRPLDVPRGVELRGPLGSGKARSFRATCALLSEVQPGPGVEGALLLQGGAGLRGLEVAFAGRSYDVAKMRPVPPAIVGCGEGVRITDVLILNADDGIDLASHRCDRHAVQGVWATTLGVGVRAGGGSQGGRLERLAFSHGPWSETWLRAETERSADLTAALAARRRTAAVDYQFGDCTGERGWGLVGFNPRISMRFDRDAGGACRDAEFHLTQFDVPDRTLLEMRAGADVRFVGLFGSGGGGSEKANWVELGPGFKGPLTVMAPTLQPGYLHSSLGGDRRLRVLEEVGYCSGRGAKAVGGGAAAIDRDPATVWAGRSGEAVTVDLGSVRTIDRFAVDFCGTASAPPQKAVNATLLVSSDGKRFSEAATLSTWGAGWGSRPVEPLRARWVRVRLDVTGGQGEARLASFDVFGPREASDAKR